MLYITSFVDVSDLSSWLQNQCGSHYATYASPLWDYGVRTVEELAHAGPSTLKEAGITSALHIDNVKATAEGEVAVCYVLMGRKMFHVKLIWYD